MESERKPGDLVIFHGRLAEVERVGAGGSPIFLGLTDDGGNYHNYTVTRAQTLKELTEPGECVLDALKRTAGRELTQWQKLERLAEEWLAAPEVGDVFLIEQGYLLEITELLDNGWIFGLQHPYMMSYPLKEKRKVSFDHDRQLRQWLKSGCIPVYRAHAFATLRELGPEEELLPSGRNSPLFSSHREMRKESGRS